MANFPDAFQGYEPTYDIVGVSFAPDGLLVIEVVDLDDDSMIRQTRQLQIPVLASEEIRDRARDLLEAANDVAQLADEFRSGQPRTITSAR